MKKTITTEHQCANCHATFMAATLSDFDYGEFLLWSHSGNCLFLNAIEDETYQEVINLIDSNSDLITQLNLNKDLLIHKIYGKLACDVDELEQSYSISNPPCPNCGSICISSVSETKIEEVMVASVTHRAWSALTALEKNKRLRKLLLTIVV